MIDLPTRMRNPTLLMSDHTISNDDYVHVRVVTPATYSVEMTKTFCSLNA